MNTLTVVLCMGFGFILAVLGFSFTTWQYWVAIGFFVAIYLAGLNSNR